MSDYRLYYLTHDGHIDRAVDHSFDDDAEAVKFGRRILPSAPGLEIWAGGRLVKKLKAPLGSKSPRRRGAIEPEA